MGTFQTQYDVNPQRGFVGAVARDNEPFVLDRLPAQVPTNGRKPRPGDAVYWDAANNGAAVPTSAALLARTIGIVTYFPGVIAQRLASIPAGSNSDTYVEYDDGEAMPVVTQGSVWLLAGAALEYSSRVQWHTSDFDWVAGATITPGTLATWPTRIVECVDLEVADAEIFIGRISLGRNV